MKHYVEGENEFYMRFKKNLKAELKFRGIGYKKIAPDIGMNFGSFSNKMATCGPSLHKFTLFEAKKIADYLNMDIYDLMEGYDDSKKR